MSKGYLKQITATLLCASVFLTAPAWAQSEAIEGAKPAPTLNLARLAAVLQAASDRKQSGTEVTLKKDAFLHARPTAEPAQAGMLRAGTLVRKSKRQIVNASGSWRHIETRDGMNGWLSELDLDPD